jgi:hypothetical protein
MSLPGIRKWDDAKVLDEAATRLAKLALGACDGQKHGNPFYGDSAFIGYPTRRNTEALVRLALTTDPLAVSDNYDRGFSLKELFAAAWERVVADEGDDAAAEALLMKKYEEILAGEVWSGTPEMIDRAVAALASYDPESLWVQYVQAAWPNHPQTPGSPGWEAAEAAGNPHETVDNPFLR